MSAKVMLPVAAPTTVRRYAWSLMRRHPRAWAAVLALHGSAAVAGLAMPWLIGRLVQEIRQGTTLSTVDHIVLSIVVFVVAQAVLIRFATLASAKLGER